MTFARNLALLTQKDPGLAQRLSQVPSAPSRPAAEEESIPDLSEVRVLYLFGLGSGRCYSLSRPWLDEGQDRYLVIFEDDLAVIRAYLHTQEAEDFLRHPRVRLISIPCTPHVERNFKPQIEALALYYYGLRYKITALPAYAKKRSADVHALTVALYRASEWAAMAVPSYLHFTSLTFSNICSNALRLDHALHARSLKDVLRGVPALICGAGPSFAKNISLLQHLGPIALIIAGGAAITYLNRHGLNPHIGASVDPTPARGNLFHFLTYETPFYFSLRTSDEVLPFLHGPLCYLSSEAAHPFVRRFEQEWHLASSVNATGHTLGDICTKMALHMGCDPIIFLGMDMCLTEDKYYASGVLQPEKRLYEGGLLPARDIHGNSVLTKPDWKGTSELISFLASLHTERHFINCTEGGLGFEGIVNRPFREVIQSVLTTPQDIAGRLHAALQQPKPLDIPRDRVKQQLHILEQSLVRCERLCKALAVATRLRQPNRGLDKELEAETGYRTLLKPFLDLLLKIRQRDLEALSRQEKAEADIILAQADKYVYLARTAHTHARVLQRFSRFGPV
jgi:hypothetical protein